MNAIQNFAFEESLVRIVDHSGDTWFVGKDICGALDIRNHKDALGRLDEDERAEVGIADPSGTKYATIISEAGVYRLVFTSRKEQAERFKRWLAHEVLPQIRRTGSYAGAAARESLPDLDNSAVSVWRTKIDLVREARIQFGAARARLLWEELGLPAVPQLPPDDEPERCLAHLLDHQVEGVTIGEFIDAAIKGDEAIAAALAQKGIRIGEGVFIIANSHPFIRRLYKGTRWKDAYRFLRRVPGAAEAKVMKFGRHITSRGIELPGHLAEPDMVH